MRLLTEAMRFLRTTDSQQASSQPKHSTDADAETDTIPEPPSLTAVDIPKVQTNRNVCIYAVLYDIMLFAKA